MNTELRQVHFFGGPLDGVSTTKFPDDLREEGEFRVRPSHGSYKATDMILDTAFYEGLERGTLPGKDIWEWKED